MQQNLLNRVLSEKPDIIYLSGKTCSGKTTLANEFEGMGYKKIELDKIVMNSVVKKYNIESHGDAFHSAYRGEGPKEHIQSFIDAAKEEIEKKLLSSSQIVIEGAIARNWILEEIFANNMDSLFFVYLLPRNLTEYARRIKIRFIAGVKTNTSGLPKDFWNQVQVTDVDEFIDTGKINQSLNERIDMFAVRSAKESEERMAHLKKAFPKMYVLEF